MIVRDRAYREYLPGSWLPVHKSWSDSAPVVTPQTPGTLLALSPARADHRVHEWSRGISELFTDLKFEALEPDTFGGMIETIHRGDLLVSHIAADAQRVRHVEGDTETLERFFLNVQLEGTGAVHSDRGETRISVGECVLVDPNESYVLEFESRFRQLCIQLPDWWLCERLRMAPAQVMGMPISMQREGGAVLRAALEAIIDLPGDGAGASLELVELFGDAMARMLRITAQTEQRQPLRQMEQAFFARLRQFVSENFRDETLTPALAAQALGCSVRYVHKVCNSNATTFGRLLMDTRLKAAAQALATASSCDRVSAVGYDSGFTDASHFSRVFRQKFGVSPRRYKMARGAIPA
ncbi:helix-turn-helix domain-containing protein [Sphingomonas flavalba]|uniref:helix-turn-helix domain-containing protein n=1 Tax=Sphingomonas flavalba TaxID=2559804 RepID=UPI001447453A|nr:helix-turn-helix domain-containing protein [Sphingomonas flavalba]